MIKLYIKESLNQLDTDLFITDYVGDVVNLLNNKPKPYRLIWFPSEDLYVIGNAYKYVHGNLEDAADKAGYIQLTDELRKSDSSATFVPYGELDHSWEVPGWEGERSIATYLKSGMLLTFRDITQSNEFPELYNKLKSTKSLKDINKDNLKDILLSYKTELNDYKKKEQRLINKCKKAGLPIRDTYTGHCDFKTFINHRDTHYWQTIADLLYVPEDKSERHNFNNFIDNIQKDLSSKFFTALSQQAHIYERIKTLLDKNDIPYEWAYQYI